MNCCEGHNQKRGAVGQSANEKPSFPKWLYLCGAGVVIALGAVFIFNIPLRDVLFFGVFLICPLMHIVMMRGHDSHKKEQ